MLRIIFVSLCLALVLSSQPIDRKAFNEVFKKTRDSIVTIEIKTTEIVNGQPKTVESGGSGSIVSSDGLIITNSHVVNNSTRSFKVIMSDGKEFAASFVGMAPDTDLSLIKLNTPPNGLKPINFGDSDKIEEGDWVLIIGSPFGLGGTVTTGIISAKARPATIPNEEGKTQPHALIQTDAAINPGNSGGALVNLEGELIGVPTIILSPTGTNIGIGFAIPVNVVKRVIQDITAKRNLGWLGLLVQDISNLNESNKKQLGVLSQSGVVVTGLENAGPAQKAGIRLYDTILEINGQNINGVIDFRWLERNLNSNEVAILTIQRRNSSIIEKIEILVGENTEQKTGQN